MAYRKCSQSELAAAIGMARSNFNKVYNKKPGAQALTFDQVAAAAKHLRVTMDWMAGFEHYDLAAMEREEWFRRYLKLPPGMQYAVQVMVQASSEHIEAYEAHITELANDGRP